MRMAFSRHLVYLFWAVGAPIAKMAINKTPAVIERVEKKNNDLLLSTSNTFIMQKLQAIRPSTNARRKEGES